MTMTVTAIWRASLTSRFSSTLPSARIKDKECNVAVDYIECRCTDPLLYEPCMHYVFERMAVLLEALLPTRTCSFIHHD